ncbi:MAG TPA: Flp pilus assembly complex ATPase component TadA [Candidatus Scybalocola faecavium]|nr:Flp pilus assembly complex ATPase component TadA [Candidatus Scybalocola faecavium]
MGDKVSVTCCGRTRTYPSRITLESVSKDFMGDYKGNIILAKQNGKLRELFKRIKNDSQVEFITTSEKIGHQTYTRTATMLMTKAAEDILGKSMGRQVIVQYSLGKGLYCQLHSEQKLNQELLDRIKSRMDELVVMDLPIQKRTISTDEAIKIFHNAHMRDKENLFRYRRSSKVNIYSLEGTEDYNYGYMAPSTGYIRLYDLYLYDNGFVLQLPDIASPNTLEPFKPSQKLFQVLKQSERWGEMLDVSTVGDLNDVISRGEMDQLILVQEALQEKNIGKIAQQIANEKKRVVLIAGPSSSGKTTFSHRLSIQLLAHGLKPHPIPVDDYFVNREDTPLDAQGNPDFECLGALNVDLFNEQMSALLRGERVQLPSFNFVTGKSEFRGNYKQIGKNDILVIEGIHGLNDDLTYSIHKDSKFKIYISALTQLNVDEHNRIPTTDGRLIRRIVRDAAARGSSCARTIAMWDSVRRGEEENIFPYQESADVMFNSVLIYELAILKLYAEPHLFGISKEQPEYDEAKRLLKFLDYFLGVSSENVPQNSILREFIGGSCFKV